MSEYNYYDAVYQSIEEYIINNVSTVEYSNPEELEEHIINDLLSNDEITGAASGSYTCNTYNAEEFLCHNWQLLQEAVDYFGAEENPIAKGPEYCDVLIRCYLVSAITGKVIRDIWNSLVKI